MAPLAERNDPVLRLGLEADARLSADPRLLADPRRLGSLHASLVGSLGESEAAAVLRQAGFLQGLREALRATAEPRAGDARAATRCDPLVPRVPLAAAPRRGASGGRDREGCPDLEGCFGLGHEAEGRIAQLGPSRGPSCFASEGYASGWLSGLLGEDVIAVEVACAASGAPRCRFRARSAEAWRRTGDARAVAALAHLDPARLRDCVPEDEEPPGDSAERFDPGMPVVHVWGPVMVVPFGGAEESLSALELIGRDESARDVSVVVVDLGGAILDEGFGALALERVLDGIERWGADAVLTGVSPLSVPVVADLESRHLLVHKDLPEAIAAAFQIADAQRRVY